MQRAMLSTAIKVAGVRLRFVREYIPKARLIIASGTPATAHCISVGLPYVENAYKKHPVNDYHYD